MALALDPAVLTHVELRLARGAEPFAEAVTRIVGVESWVLVLGCDGRVRSLAILGHTATPAVRPAPLERREAHAADAAMVKLRFGEIELSPQQLLDVAIRDADPLVRTAALRAGLRALAADPGLEGAVEDAIDAVDDRTLADLVTSAVGNEAASVLGLVASEAADRPIGRRARAVLAHLR